MTATPNGYGQMAMAHMAEYLPSRFAAIHDPESHFAAVGEEVLREINEMMAAWERAQTPPIDDGRRNMTRRSVEEIVLGEMVFLTPEADPDEPEIDESGAWVGPSPGMGEWIPLDLTPQEWDEIDEEVRRESEEEFRREASQAD